MKIERTGRDAAFLDLFIGSPFYAHGRYWVRTSFEAATELKSSLDGLGSRCCNFIIDGTTRPKRGPYDHKGETCETVEIVEVRDVT
jgi:hypothetical protein